MMREGYLTHEDIWKACPFQAEFSECIFPRCDLKCKGRFVERSPAALTVSAAARIEEMTRERDEARIWHEKAHTFLEERNAYKARADAAERQLAEAIAALSLASLAETGGREWRPIETAPKDGTKIDLLYPYPRGRAVNCFWSNDKHHRGWFWREPRWAPAELECRPESEWSWNCYPNMHPTHWMPLPPAPSSSDGEPQS